MPYLKFLLVLTVFLSFLYSCDSTLTPKDYSELNPSVRNLTVSPSSIQFDPLTDGQKDTTLTFSLSVDGFDFETDSTPFYSLFIDDNSEPESQGQFAVNFSPLTTFQINVPIQTSTLDFRTYTFLVTPNLSGDNKNYTQAIVTQTGVPINAPELLEVNNPVQVEIPNDSQSITVLFTAKVRDLDGQDNIERVLLNFRNEDGSMLSANPFEMFDDGLGSSSTGDVQAADSVYTRTFSITSVNTPNNRTALYWAIDKSGLSSDTLETTFNLVDNE